MFRAIWDFLFGNSDEHEEESPQDERRPIVSFKNMPYDWVVDAAYTGYTLGEIPLDEIDMRTHVVDELQGLRDKKVNAIKLVRQVTGMGLKEAKAWVDLYFLLERTEWPQDEDEDEDTDEVEADYLEVDSEFEEESEIDWGTTSAPEQDRNFG